MSKVIMSQITIKHVFRTNERHIRGKSLIKSNFTFVLNFLIVKCTSYFDSTWLEQESVVKKTTRKMNRLFHGVNVFYLCNMTLFVIDVLASIKLALNMRLSPQTKVSIEIESITSKNRPFSLSPTTIYLLQTS